MNAPDLHQSESGPFLRGNPRGVVRVALGEFHRHHWHYLRLVRRKSFIVEISMRKGGKPLVVLVPHLVYWAWLLQLNALRSAEA